MGSVISDVECNNCGYEGATEDYYYKSNEVYVFCHRCGYSYSRTIKYDIKKGKRIYKKVKELIAKKKYAEAVKIANLSVFSPKEKKWVKKGFADKDALKELREFLKRIKDYKFEYYYLADKDGHWVFDKQEIKPEGMTQYSVKGGVGSLLGNYDNVDSFIDWVKKNKDGLKSAEYTKKIDGRWYKINAFNGKKEPFDDMDIQATIK